MPNDSLLDRALPRISTIATPIGVAMLIVWAVWTFAFDAPGVVHALLTLGVVFVIWGIVARGAPYPHERPRR